MLHRRGSLWCHRGARFLEPRPQGRSIRLELGASKLAPDVLGFHAVLSRGLPCVGLVKIGHAG